MAVIATKVSTEVADKYAVDRITNTFSYEPKSDPKDLIQVEIGDSKDITKFQPQVKIMRWDNEVNLSIRLKDNQLAIEVITTTKEKIVWDKGKIEANFYDLPEGEGGYEFEVILKERPLTNRLEFSLNTKGLIFYYQPAMTEEIFKKGQTADETHIYDKDGNVVSYRPEKVVGSYAVYASENKVNWVGGKEYKCGQVGFIYRPKIIDSVGTEVWGQLHVNTASGILSVTIPQEFLDKAVYPVRHAAGLNFGYETKGGTTMYLPNRIAGPFFTGVAGTLDSITHYIKYRSEAHKTKCALYSKATDNNALVSGSPTAEYNVAADWDNWKLLACTTPPAISAIDYFIVTYGNSYSYYYYNTNAITIATFYDQTYGNFPATMPNATQKWLISIYATYTPAEGAIKKVINEVERAVEAFNYIRSRFKVISEVERSVESQNYLPGWIKVFTEVVNIVEAKNYIRNRLKVINEILHIGELKNSIRNRFKVIAEVLNLSEIKNYTRSRFKVISEFLNLAESFNHLRARLKVVSETLNISEAKNYIRGRLKITSEAINLSEAKNYIRGRLAIISEVVNISEAVNKLRSLFKIINEVVSIVENTVHKIVAAFVAIIKVINEAVNTSEAFNKLRNLYRIVSETLRISELIPKVRGYIRIVNNTIRLVETNIKAFHFVRVITEVIRISELVNHLKWFVNYIFISPAKVAIIASGRVLTFISCGVGTIISKAKTLIFKSIKNTNFEGKP